jgi:hypothetical protein
MFKQVLFKRLMYTRSIFIRLMVKRFAIAVLSLAAAPAATAQSLPEMRMTPAEIQTSALDSNQIGSSGLPGVHTKVVFGDPSKVGFYTILLFVPAHTTIQAHTHRDDRVAVVVSGEWHLGYGTHFDAKSLKTLPPGSVLPSGATRTMHPPKNRQFQRYPSESMADPSGAPRSKPARNGRSFSIVPVEAS